MKFPVPLEAVAADGDECAIVSLPPAAGGGVGGGYPGCRVGCEGQGLEGQAVEAGGSGAATATRGLRVQDLLASAWFGQSLA